MSRTADVEVEFFFNGVRKNSVQDGYRPAHLIKANYLTTGIHHYYENSFIPPDGRGIGTITFLTPEEYPHCLWIGKIIPVQEGSRIVGYAKVIRILNPMLSQYEEKYIVKDKKT